MTIDFKQQADAMREELIARRRELHQHPELSFEEVWTSNLVARELNDLGLEVQTGIGQTGVVGILEGAHDGPTVLVRADMDALPVTEENTFDYVSTIPGKMHACGHDGHVTVGLAVARLLSQHRDAMAGRVKFVFQPAEEGGKGARAMVQDGVLQDPRPDVSLGLHLWTPLESGVVGIAEGPVMAGCTIFDIKIGGRGGHAAQPHTTIDPLLCATTLVNTLQSIISRNVDPLDTAVLSITYLRAGETYNVIPETAALKGTVRAFRPEVRDMVLRRLHEITQSVCAAMGCTFEISSTTDTNPVINDVEVTRRLRQVFAPIAGEAMLDTSARTMSSEDMSHLMTDIPGVYFFVGAKDPMATTYYGHHHPRFTFDENVMPLAVALMASAVASYVLDESDANH